MIKRAFTKTKNLIRNDKFLANSSILFIGAFLVSAFNYLFHFLMARMLSVENYGELQSLLAVFTIVGVLTAAISTVLIKYVAAFKAKNWWAKIHNLFLISIKKILVPAGIFLIVFVVSSGYITDFLNLSSVTPVIILGASFILVFLQSINTGVLQGLQKFKDISIISVIAAFFRVLLAVLLVKFGFAVNGAVGAMVLSGLIGYVISFLPLKFLFKKAKEKVETKEIFQYFFPVLFTLLFITLIYNIDVILVKHFFSPQIAGEYSALAIIGRIIFFISGPIIAVMFPMAAEAHSGGGDHIKIFKKTFFLVSAIGLGILLFYFLFPDLIIKILVGSKFLSISKFLGWFGVSMFLYSLVGLFSRYFLSIHKTRCVYLVGVGALLQIVLIYFFHSSLWQIIWIMNIVMFIALILLIGYYFLIKRSLIDSQFQKQKIK